MDLTTPLHQEVPRATTGTPAHRYKELQVLQQRGQIRQLVQQPSWSLVPRFFSHRVPACRICYIADFAYTDNSSGHRIVEAGRDTESLFQGIKRVLLTWMHGIIVHRA
ncbi:DUF1064 domain-containing protein [Alcaligenes faecalis]|uniref:DUF1064 domain-containing protein n=1 Tax=Alcaligenes faecalis TaxID=511 RepID=UPI001292FB09|nr:DUF1064 domain-containing protein [Alcaligenes faecalis]MBX6965881.1 DUF1064 domain-containing protein [Providencia rettgeri]MBX7031316.1 DUF1064 domain-containing protein [Alcaligenes faecalis]QFY77536.1 DUF1064 domain-containing protein [Alcaligenes faecalis]